MRSLVLAFAASLMLAGCAAGLSPPQRLYQAHGTYNVALGGAVKYAETPGADAALVQQATNINRQVAPSVVLAGRLLQCREVQPTEPRFVTLGCDKLDTSQTALLSTASRLEGARKSILALLARIR